jgi:hypothetical protein
MKFADAKISLKNLIAALSGCAAGAVLSLRKSLYCCT